MMMIPPTAAPTPVPTFAPVENELLVVDVDFVAGGAIKLDADFDVVLTAEVNLDLVVEGCRAVTLRSVTLCAEGIIASDDAL
jgi:hypothetical protein